MSRKMNTLFGAAALVAGTAFVTSTVTGNQHAEPEMSPEWEAMEQAWMEYMTPGEHHEGMMEHAGTWKMTAKMWMDPAAPPTESVNEVFIKPIMGGRFLLEHVKGEPDAMMPGVTFEGMNIAGYNKHTKTYNFAWVDNMGTGIFTGKGSANADGSVITYMAESPDLANPGAMKPVKSIVRHEGDDKMVFEMHEIGPSGDWWKSFVGVYTRTSKAGKMMDKGMKHGH